MPDDPDDWNARMMDYWPPLRFAARTSALLLAIGLTLHALATGHEGSLMLAVALLILRTLWQIQETLRR